MTANELRIGNWVKIDSLTDGHTQDVQAGSFHLDEMGTTVKYKYSPIPLTEEWLLKLGFQKRQLQEYDNWTTYECQYLKVLIDKPKGIEFDWMIARNVDFDPKIRYVHQLQNLYFALTNNELKNDSTNLETIQE